MTNNWLDHAALVVVLVVVCGEQSDEDQRRVRVVRPTICQSRCQEEQNRMYRTFVRGAQHANSKQTLHIRDVFNAW